jgi:NADH-quinone oxidoreductase subunit E
MTKDTNDKAATEMATKEMASAVNLLVHPVAGAAAFSALSFGLVSHAFGVWMGALNGAAEVSQRLFDPEFDGQPGKSDGIVSSKQAPKATKPKRAAVVREAEPKRARQPAADETLVAADDLKAILGVGPKLEQVLNGLGVRCYGQIAAWTDEEIAAMEEALGFSGRIGRDDWIGQAAALAEARTKH